MRTFDRIVLVVLAIGIWALVLKPSGVIAVGDGNTNHIHSWISELARKDHHHEVDGIFCEGDVNLYNVKAKQIPSGHVINQYHEHPVDGDVGVSIKCTGIVE